MKKRMTAMICIGVMAASMAGCGNKEPVKSDAGEAEPVRAEASGEQEDVLETQGEASGEQEESVEEAEDGFSFDSFGQLEFWFCSGAGGWATIMNIDGDGSFSGEYFDGDMGDTGAGYPNGTMYQCNFSGQFTQPEKVNDYTYSMQIGELNYEQEPGTEEIRDGVRYCYDVVYGLAGAEDILIYLPGAPLAELPEEFRSWVGYYDLSAVEETELPFYALNNEAQQYGFYSQDIIENLKESMAYTEELADSLETSIEQDPLSQAELNEKAAELYNLWDDRLNDLWSVLKRTLDEETMAALTVEEREWIAEKERAVTEAGAEVEGGSMQPMVMSGKGAYLTRERVYELLELLE